MSARTEKALEVYGQFLYVITFLVVLGFIGAGIEGHPDNQTSETHTAPSATVTP